MKEEVSNCGRESELISFLYGELNDIEAQTFQRHLRDCAACNVELAAFGDVRESVVAWRNESLGAMVAPRESANHVTNLARARATSNKAASPSAQGAWAALREFFNLSPLWLKGAVAFAALLFCLLSGLAVARLREQPKVVVTSPTPAQSQQEINALVDRRVQEEIERFRNARQQQKDALTADSSSPKNPVKRVQDRNMVVADARKARRPLSKTEREQLAADLRLTSGKNDSDFSLLDDRINQ